MATYRYLTYDLLSNAVLADLPFSDVTYGEVLNKPGSFSGTLPMFGDDAVTLANIEVGRVGLLVERDGSIVWNGIIWTIDTDVQTQRVRVGAEGTWSYFQRRIIHPIDPYGDLAGAFAQAGLTGPYYYDADPLLIARELVTFVQSTAVFGGLASIHVGTGSETSSARVEQYEINEMDYRVCGNEIESLAGAWEKGFDFRIVASWQAGAISKVLQLGQPHIGTRRPVTYELGRNVTSFSVGWDGKRLAGWVVGQGKDSIFEHYLNPSYTYPLYDDAHTWGDVDDETRVALLTIDRANKHKIPLATPRITTNDSVDPDIHSLVPGDEVRVVASYGLLAIDGYYRINAYDVSPGNDGNASVKVDLAPTELFDE